MARTTFVKKRTVGKRGERVLNCSTCRQPIEYGTPYKWFKRKSSYGGTVFAYHSACEIRPSHRTTSKMGTIYDAQHDFKDGDSPDDIEQNLASFAETVREVAQEYRDSADNIEQGFGHTTYQSEELAERADSLDQWADDIDQVDLDHAEPTEDDVNEPTFDDDQIAERVEELREEWLAEQNEKAQEAINECPV